MVDRVHTLVVGAGVIGLAIARRLARDHADLLVLESEDGIGTQTSSRNSEVIHAGMYYAAGSLRARTCVEGRRRLYDYCERHGVAYRRTGKLIVATEPAHLAVLKGIADRARTNGLVAPGEALAWLDAAAVREREPALDVLAALWSPATGIVDTHGLMLAYLGDAERAGAMLSLRTRFVGAARDGDGWRVRTAGPDGDYELHCTRLVNAAGLQAQRVASRIAGLDPVQVPPALWLKGSYFTVAGAQPPFRHLIYPVPSGGGLGVHLTLDLAGQARFGPDTEPVPVDPESQPDYQVDPRRADAFYAAIRRYWPGLRAGALQPAYAGLRPRIAQGADTLDASDFRVDGPERHGLAGLVNLFGIESPGITASLALAERVADRLAAR